MTATRLTASLITVIALIVIIIAVVSFYIFAPPEVPEPPAPPTPPKPAATSEPTETGSDAETEPKPPVEATDGLTAAEREMIIEKLGKIFFEYMLDHPEKYPLERMQKMAEQLKKEVTPVEHRDGIEFFKSVTYEDTAEKATAHLPKFKEDHPKLYQHLKGKGIQFYSVPLHIFEGPPSATVRSDLASIDIQYRDKDLEWRQNGKYRITAYAIVSADWLLNDEDQNMRRAGLELAEWAVGYAGKEGDDSKLAELLVTELIQPHLADAGPNNSWYGASRFRLTVTALSTLQKNKSWERAIAFAEAMHATAPEGHEKDFALLKKSQYLIELKRFDEALETIRQIDPEGVHGSAYKMIPDLEKRKRK